MEKIYMICLIAGFCIPLFSLIIGSIFDIFEGVLDGILNLADIGSGVDFSIGICGIDFCILPFSLQCLSAGAVMFGGVGKILYDKDNLLMANVIAGSAGYLVAVLFQTLVHKLKKIENTTYAKEDLLMFDAKVVNSIVKGGYGSIRIATYDGISTVYPARAISGKYIKQDTIVKIDHFEKNVAYVRVKEKDNVKQS
ncbi:MAG: hypothetical protein IKL07_09970 [Clostridium sp.]|nr:hypothetical protein [Clostridium sp.]